MVNKEIYKLEGDILITTSLDPDVYGNGSLTISGDLIVLGNIIIDHGSLTGLTDDDHTQYALLLGRSGGQILIGGTASSNNLILRSTSNATKGSILIDETTASSSSSTGSLVLSGGIGVSLSTDATSSTNGGSITIAGGMAIAKKLFVGTDLAIGGVLTINSISPILTASNVGIGGVGIYKQKTGTNLELKNINNGSTKVSITNDTGNNEIDIDIVEANINHLNLSNIGTNTHSQIDTFITTGTAHIASTTEHGATGAVVGTTNTQTLTNKTITDSTISSSTNTVGATELRTTGSSVVISSASPPSTGQYIKATSATTATWQTITVDNTVKSYTIRDEKSSGTNGGASSTSWTIRTLNTLYAPDSSVTLSSNTFTLVSGTYYISLSVPAFFTGLHKARLKNNTDTTYIYGTSESSTTNGNDTLDSRSFLDTYVNIGSSKTYQVEHICSTVNGSNGYGVSCGFSGIIEVYTIVTILKLS